jgi:DNA-binding LytR/AlgR family response regulator
MKVVIIEDEGLAVERLITLIRQYDPNIEIVAQLDSIESSVDWFPHHPAPDLCFFDIQLADGLSFKIFEKVSVKSPVIFTTAYNEYALQAFKVNSIDYLLKPIDYEELASAFEQFHQYTNQHSTPDLEIIQEAARMITRQKKYKSRFMVKAGHQLLGVPVEEVAYFFSEHKTTWLKTTDGLKHAIDYKLEEVEHLVDPARFFRLNRKYITAFGAIEKITSYTNSRLKVQLWEAKGEKILVSREKVGDFKEWLDQ